MIYTGGRSGAELTRYRLPPEAIGELRMTFLVFGLVGLAVALILYLLPAILALVRSHPHRWAILVVNVCFGFSVLGWLIALIWALSDPGAAVAGPAVHQSGRIIDGIATPVEPQDTKV
jgi:hypothetical protein